MRKGKYIIILSLLLLQIVACDKETINEEDKAFNRTAMLTEYRDSIILLSYKSVLQRVTDLEIVALGFDDSAPTISQLNDIQEKWYKAALAWQSALMFNFGPAGEAGLKKTLQEEAGTFPVSISKIQNVMSTGVWNLNDFNRDARGMYAIEYLIFDATATPEIMLQRFESENYRNYLKALCKDLKDRISAVNSAWNSYGNEFVSNAGTDAGSSVSLMYNEFVKSYEGLKNFKFGLPLGLRPGQTAPDVTLLEGRFSKKSYQLAYEHFKKLIQIYRGTKAGKSFKAYLESVTGGPALVKATEAQITVLTQKFESLGENVDMETAISTNYQDLVNIHTELQKNTKNFKSDMSSLLGIAITYASGDGD
jgi:uncharacterized protein